MLFLFVDLRAGHKSAIINITFVPEQTDAANRIKRGEST